MPAVGELAPDFELLNQDGKTVRLSDFRGQKVVLFVFPKANTMGCNAQACGFRDEFEAISARNAVILGLSADSPETLEEWKRSKQLPYDLLSDPEHAVIEAWGAYGLPLLGLVRLPMIQRGYWVIDEQGTMVAMKVPVAPGDSVKRALEAVNIQVTPPQP
ncbi:MAG: peroxiredoxin [Anaerolineae bacterium]|nr:peroxiredoxin [Anaerolineae bacterium]